MKRAAASALAALVSLAPAAALADGPTPADVVSLARGEIAAGRAAAACPLLEQALARAPRAVARSEIAMCWERAGDKERARAAWLAVASLSDERLAGLPAPSASPYGSSLRRPGVRVSGGLQGGGIAMVATGFVLGTGGLVLLGAAGFVSLSGGKSAAAGLGVGAAVASGVGAVLVGTGFYVRAKGRAVPASTVGVGLTPSGLGVAGTF